MLTVALALAAVCAALPKNVHGTAPTPVLRTFGFWVLEDVPDFQSEDSQALLVLPNATDPEAGSSFQLFTDENHTDLRTWVLAPVNHVVHGGQAPNGDYFWLIDEETPTLPPAGALTLTGPDGAIESVQVVRIKQCNSTECGVGNGGRWMIDEVYGTSTLIVVSAWFSK